MSCLLAVSLQLSLKNTCMIVRAGLKDRQVDAARTGISYSHSVPFFSFILREVMRTQGGAGGKKLVITVLLSLRWRRHWHFPSCALLFMLYQNTKYSFVSPFKNKVTPLPDVQNMPVCSRPWLERWKNYNVCNVFLCACARLTDMSWVTASQLVWDAGRGESYCRDRQHK